MSKAVEDWRANLVEDAAGIADVVRSAHRIAVIGMKTEAHAGQPAFYVPQYMMQAGCEVIPVLVYYPDVTEVLGQKVHRSLATISGPIDMVNVFRRPEDVPKHVDEILAARPKSVFLQLGIRNDAAAEAFARAGIRVVQDRCLMVEHRRLR